MTRRWLGAALDDGGGGGGVDDDADLWHEVVSVGMDMHVGGGDGDGSERGRPASACCSGGDMRAGGGGT